MWQFHSQTKGGVPRNPLVVLLIGTNFTCRLWHKGWHGGFSSHQLVQSRQSTIRVPSLLELTCCCRGWKNYWNAPTVCPILPMLNVWSQYGKKLFGCKAKKGLLKLLGMNNGMNWMPRRSWVWWMRWIGRGRSCFTELVRVMNCVCNQLPPLASWFVTHTSVTVRIGSLLRLVGRCYMYSEPHLVNGCKPF